LTLARNRRARVACARVNATAGGTTMTRIEGAQAKWNKPLLRVVYWMTRRHIRGITERETERAIEPAEVYGHLPGLLIGYGMFVSAAERTGRVDQCLKGLATVKAAT